MGEAAEEEKIFLKALLEGTKEEKRLVKKSVKKAEKDFFKNLVITLRRQVADAEEKFKEEFGVELSPAEEAELRKELLGRMSKEELVEYYRNLAKEDGFPESMIKEICKTVERAYDQFMEEQKRKIRRLERKASKPPRREKKVVQEKQVEKQPQPKKIEFSESEYQKRLKELEEAQRASEEKLIDWFLKSKMLKQELMRVLEVSSEKELKKALERISVDKNPRQAYEKYLKSGELHEGSLRFLENLIRLKKEHDKDLKRLKLKRRRR